MRAPPDRRSLRRLLDRLLEAEAGRFSLWLAPSVVAGVALYFDLPFEPPPWLGAAAALPLLAAAIALRHRLTAYPFALLAAASLGFAADSLATWRAAPIEPLPHRATTVRARVAEVELLPKGRRLVLAHPAIGGAAPLARDIRVTLRASDTTTITAGSTLRLRAILFRPSPPAWPGGWDLQRDAFFANLAGYGFILGKPTLLGTAPAGFFAGLRGLIRARVAAAVPGPPGAIAATLLTGTEIGIPPANRAAFAASGLAHLLAIAGLHIGIVMGLVFLAARLLLALWEYASLFWPTKALAALASLAAGAFYMELTGAHLPIERSFAMASLVVLALLAGRRALSMRGLMLAMAALALWQPEAVMGPSFQMSFAAVLALIAGYRALERHLAPLGTDRRLHRRLLHHIVLLATTSLLAGGASTPYAAWNFGRMQIYFVLSNLLAVPLTALWTMPLGLLSAALMPLHLERPTLIAMGWGTAATLAIARFFAHLPAASIAVPHAPAWGLVVTSLGLAWLCLWRSRLRLAGFPAIALGVLSAWLIHPPDLIIAPNTLALRHGGQVLTATLHGRQAFTLEQIGQALPWRQSALPCAATACTLGPGVTLLRGQAPCPASTIPANTVPARIVISFAPVTCGPGSTVIDPATLQHTGAVAIWLGRHPALVTDREVRGTRPWVQLGPTQAAAPIIPQSANAPSANVQSGAIRSGRHTSATPRAHHARPSTARPGTAPAQALPMAPTE